jgi:hypothetical protein
LPLELCEGESGEASLSHSHSRIDHAIENVDDEIAENRHNRNYEHDAEKDGKVSCLRGVPKEQAGTRVVKEGFNDERTRDGVRQREP